MAEIISVLVSGAGGKMGSETVRAVTEADGLELVGAADPAKAEEDAGELAGLPHNGVTVRRNLAEAIEASMPDLVIDFTHPEAAFANAKTAIEAGCHLLVGTTGLQPAESAELAEMAEARSVGVLIAPNFAIGAVLMMRFAAEAAPFMDGCEIIELHHDEKADAPSGTALRTAELINGKKSFTPGGGSRDVSRGLDVGGVMVHSVRLKGLVAHQEVVFGALGQTLTIRHDTTDRRSFMPGVIMAAKAITARTGLIVGLENLLFERD